MAAAPFSATSMIGMRLEPFIGRTSRNSSLPKGNSDRANAWPATAAAKAIPETTPSATPRIPTPRRIRRPSSLCNFRGATQRSQIRAQLPLSAAARYPPGVVPRESPMDQRIINLYDSFTHGYIHRREFLDRLTQLTGSTAAATALLPLLTCDYSKAATIAENDPRLVAERASYDSSKGKINGYLVRPKDKV